MIDHVRRPRSLGAPHHDVCRSYEELLRQEVPVSPPVVRTQNLSLAPAILFTDCGRAGRQTGFVLLHPGRSVLKSHTLDSLVRKHVESGPRPRRRCVDQPYGTRNCAVKGRFRRSWRAERIARQRKIHEINGASSILPCPLFESLRGLRRAPRRRTIQRTLATIPPKIGIETLCRRFHRDSRHHQPV